MQVTVNKPNPTEVELTIELSVDEVQPHVDAAAKRISKEVTVKGFRKGHVPYDILVQQVGEGVIYEEAFNDMVQATYPEAVDQEKLQVVGRAEIDREKLAPGNPVIYTAKVSLMPTVELGDYKTLKTKQPAVTVDEEKYKKTIEDLQRAYASQAAVERAAKMGDVAVVDFNIMLNGVPIDGGQATNQEIRLEEGAFVDDFLKNIVGLKAGDEKEFQMTFPEKYHQKSLQGQTCDVTLKVHTVQEVTVPAWDEAFATQLNFENLEKLEASIKERIMQELEQAAAQEFEMNIIKEIIKLSKISEMPESMINEELDKMMNEMKADIERQNIKFDDYLTHIKKTEDELRADFKPQAIERLQAALVLREVAIAESITVDTADVDAKLADIQKQFATSPEMQGYINNPAYRNRLENQLIHEKLFEKLKGFVK